MVRWLPAVLLVFTVLIHLPTFDQPLVERHNFRQTQTAFTARIYHEEGIDLFDPKLPVLGPPWEVPFEFPLFQAAASKGAAPRSSNISRWPPPWDSRWRVCTGATNGHAAGSRSRCSLAPSLPW